MPWTKLTSVVTSRNNLPFQDGRLRADDQLISADGLSLKGLKNKEAMQKLKQALERAGRMPSLSLVVARKDSLNLSADRRSAK